MSRLKTFDLLEDPKPESVLETRIWELKNKIREKFEETGNKFLSIAENSFKSHQTMIDDETKYVSWSDDSYLNLYEFALKCDVNAIKSVVDSYDRKFKNERMPINYLTSILRSRYKNLENVYSFIDNDLEIIRKKIKERRNDKEWVKRNIPPEFIKLNLKINQDKNLDLNSKKMLNHKVNETHKKVQEWIRKI